ncbi:MAG: hypothetical protein NT062_36370 [Proteobacteria bacterium]|nr:hypothetical protein [Pseudomonadota bacterium]
MKKTIDSMNILDALADEAARYEVEEGKPTAESRAATTRYRGFIDDRLAAMRRAELEQLGPVHVERHAIRPDLLALLRDALVARLVGLQERFPALGFAHRNLTDVTDDDLRTMIQDAEAATEDLS